MACAVLPLATDGTQKRWKLSGDLILGDGLVADLQKEDQNDLEGAAAEPQNEDTNGRTRTQNSNFVTSRCHGAAVTVTGAVPALQD
jgi:hypothetical protein